MRPANSSPSQTTGCLFLCFNMIGDGRGRIEPIADVAARHGDHRLVVLGGGDGFFEPLSNRLDPGVEQALAQWTPRAVLSTKPIQTWSGHEPALVDQGGF